MGYHASLLKDCRILPQIFIIAFENFSTQKVATLFFFGGSVGVVAGMGGGRVLPSFAASFVYFVRAVKHFNKPGWRKRAKNGNVAWRGAELRNANCDGQLPVGCTSSWLGFVPRPRSRAFARHTLQWEDGGRE